MPRQGKDVTGGSTSARRSETSAERADRNLEELLQELRVALPGVQVLFAFLLTVPFASGFGELTGFQRDLYFGLLICTALATVLLIAPTAYHRVLFRQRDKRHLVEASNRFAIAGIAMLAVSTTAAILLIADLLFGPVEAALFAGVIGVAVAALWFVVPVSRRRRLEDDSG